MRANLFSLNAVHTRKLGLQGKGQSTIATTPPGDVVAWCEENMAEDGRQFFAT